MGPQPAPTRRVEYLRLDEIQRAARNPKQHDRDGINRSIDRHGFGELPLMDERTGRLIAGHGRLAELAQMHAAGKTPPDGILVDGDGVWKAPVVRGWASKSDADAEAYLLASNQTTIRGGWHDQGLTEMLADIARTDFDLAVVAGWDAPDIEALLAATVVPVPVPPVAVPEAPVVAVEAPTVPDPAPLPPAPVRASTAPSEAPPAVESPKPQPAPLPPAPVEPGKQASRYAGGTVEMILTYSEEDRTEIGRLLSAARGLLGPDLKAPEIVLRALRTMCTVLDYRDTGPVDMRKLARAAGWSEGGTR